MSPTPSPPNEAPRVRLGELLVQTRVITQEQLTQALDLQKAEAAAGRTRRLGVLLIEKGFVDETQLTQVLGRQLSVPWVSLYHVDFSRQLLNLVPREVAEAYTIVPVYVRHVRGQGDRLYVATDDPTNDEGLKRVSAFAGLPVRPMIASATDIRAAIRVYYLGGAPSQPRQAAAPSVQPAPPKEEAIQPAQPAPAAVGERAAMEPVQDSARRESVQVRVVDPPVETPSIVASPKPPSPAVAAELEPVSAAGKPALPVDDDGPEIEAHSIPIPPKKGRRAIALTFLDGTTISIPAPRTAGQNAKTIGPGGSVARTRARAGADEDLAAGEEDELTARDMIAALRAVSHGADASEILGENPKWEKIFAALLSLLLRKHLIADWEFVEEYRKI